MTYCVGLLLNEGMVCLSDTRTNAGLDNISTYRKMFHFEEPGERVITIMTAGSLSITQTTLARLREAIEDPEATEETSIMKAPTMLKVASIIGGMLSTVRPSAIAPEDTTSTSVPRAFRAAVRPATSARTWRASALPSISCAVMRTEKTRIRLWRWRVAMRSSRGSTG